MNIQTYFDQLMSNCFIAYELICVLGKYLCVSCMTNHITHVTAHIVETVIYTFEMVLCRFLKHTLKQF